ncbi:TadE/TadG family type IV pilus assembly protein [Ectobacillus sp. sgz5001026]|uniref:TadE/TadG family type IV pilus assembly protein n=1 Tax=Ectobacillus sp. sgz5001026 TaxID=3242473 RepID=UPI0036D34BF2
MPFSPFSSKGEWCYGKKFVKLAKQEHGQSLVEFALIVPIFLLMLVGMINLGFVLFTYLSLNMTAQEASRLAGLGKTDADIIQYVQNQSTVRHPANIRITITPDQASRISGSYTTVTLSYPMADITPVFDQFLSPYNLQTQSTIRVD